MWLKPFSGGNLDALTIEFGFTRVLGKSKDSGLSLSDIPPWNSRLVFNWNRKHEEGPFSGYLQFRHTGEGINSQMQLNPVYQDTDSFLVIDFGLSIKVFDTGRLHLGLLNVLDKLTYAYLQPPVTIGPVGPSGGDLSGGDRIPLPGRSYTCSLSWGF